MNLVEFRLIETPPFFPKIVHKPSEFFFQFGQSHVTFSPARPPESVSDRVMHCLYIEYGFPYSLYDFTFTSLHATIRH